ncbi:FACT complex component Spt16 [Schizosaccharomyces cryophilus OY26]|uniref:FACT complex subunit n=1 Tax=Schizosaccharomyces cryophilus (strain OY26 / ATCC MYA-4695 / CBS 11777 / NBRC 106824 / NRRL Y48691) TaxID=653667 RepID=S9W752_SCHCR|nr:FACT complex component Spt16 [Schizosaccharomyces cryophilus OY26]EPY53715.1 FACT complex component Spt16 [Schizosaccharomyces cryophilus OY26]
MSEYHIDANVFHKRLNLLLSSWKEASDANELFQGCESILVVIGTADVPNPYQKSAAMHTWLLGYEFPSTLMLVEKERVTFLTSNTKASMLAQLLETDNKAIDVNILKRTKDPAENRALFDEIIKYLRATNKKVGIFPKDINQGKFVNEWNEVFEPVKSEFEMVDASMGLAKALAVKDELEISNVKDASRVSVASMTKYFADELSTYVDRGVKTTHSKFAERVERLIDNESFFQKKDVRLGDIDTEQLEWCYTPIIQSGGQYDLKPSAITDDRNLHGDVVLCSLGIRYKSYCSNIGRTYLFDPSPEQQKNYSFLVALQRKLIEYCRDGTVIKDIYTKILGFIRSKRPELESHFVKNLGAGIGIEFRESSLLVNAKNTRTLKAGMTMNLSIGFANLVNPRPKNSHPREYSLLLVDTIQVTRGDPVVFTDSPKAQADISYFFGDEADDIEDGAKQRKPSTRGTATVSSHKGKTRSETREVDDSVEKRRAEHQKQLAARKQAEGLQRFAEGSTHTTGVEKPTVKRYESYKRDSQMPQAIGELRILVDYRAQSIILPIFGRPVPFHISSLKNASKNDEGSFVYLRLNFLSPGQIGGKKDELPFEDPNAQFIRSFTFRSSDSSRMNQIFKDIQDMKKAATKREAERKEFADVVEQENLIEIKNRRPIHLNDVYVRPALDGKRLPGFVEIHQNGIRYQSPLRSDSHIDLLFSNMKHLFFQPCEGELIVLVHIHLKAPIMVGKRKTQDVQFYREVSDIQFDETGNKKRKYMYGDEDEIEQEQEERRRRAQLDREFKTFGERIAEASDGRVELDIPFRELAFSGVPFRSNVLLQPTTDCLVQLTDTPFTVVTLSEIEIAHLERVQFGLKNFDLVFIFQDFHRPPVHINTIPMEQLDNTKEWLDSCDICFSEGPLNLNWTTIMKTVNEDPVAFFQEGGWGFLGTGSDDEAENSDEEVSEYEGSDVEPEEEESEEGSEEYSEAASDEDFSGSEVEEEEESGEDWDELERKALQEDAKREQNGDHPIKKRR